MAEFKKGDIAHINNGTRVCGQAHPEAETEQEAGIKRLTLKYGDACTIIKVHPSKSDYAKRFTGGATYDVTHERDGVLYYIENIEQRAFCTKYGWETDQRLRAELGRLKEDLKKQEQGK